LAQVLLDVGRVDEARQAVDQAVGMHREFGCVPGQRQAFAVVEQMKGR
jgi:hypothetical protein